MAGLRIYEWNRFQAIVLGNPLPAGFGIFVTGLGPPTTNDSWLARVILHTNLSADAIMGGTPAINEAAFDALSVVYTICWNDENVVPQALADPSLGGSELLGATTHRPTIVKHWTNANELLVNYEQEFECDVSGLNRHFDPATGAVPSVNVGLWFVDPLGITRHSVPFPITWRGNAWLETLWWHRP